MMKEVRGIFKDRRAITPVLSNLLLLVVAVAAMSIATTATYVITTNLKETMSERLIIEDLWFNNSTREIDVYLHNIGKVAVSVSAIYVNHTSRPFTGPSILEIGKHGWFNISHSWTENSLYHINIVTERGTRVEGYFEAP
jgi:hypothetical protein